MTERSTPIRTLTPSTVAAYLVAAFCALLLAKWLAVAALAAFALFVGVRWLAMRLLRARRGPAGEDDDAAGAALDHADDCTWCGLAGGHRDPLGRPLRPRHAHGMPRAA